MSRWRRYTTSGRELWGVMKLFDLGGKVVDATVYTGQQELRFGRDYTPYLVASIALETPTHFIPIDMGWCWQMEGARVAAGGSISITID